MSHVNQVCFSVKNTPDVPGKKVYIQIKEGKHDKQFPMIRNNDEYQILLDVKKNRQYNYKYLVVDSNLTLKKETEFRNFAYEKDETILDSWNKRLVILRIQTTQQSIINGLKINVYQKNRNEMQIKSSEIELKQVQYNMPYYYYEGIISGESALSVLEFQFIFNAYKQYTSSPDQQYMKNFRQNYPILKTIGNQSFIEITENEFNKLSYNPNLNKLSQSVVNNLQNLPHNYKCSFELSNDKIQNLLQIHDTILRNYEEKLQSKDKQIQELQLEILQQDKYIIFNYQDAFQSENLSEYQKQFYSIVEDIQKKQNSIFNQFKEDFNQHEQTVQEYKTAVQDYKTIIQDNTKTIYELKKKVIQEKKLKGQNGQKIEQLENNIQTYIKLLERKKRAVEQLEEQLNKEKKNNQEMIKENKQFQNQIVELDNEIKEVQRKNENILKEIQTASKEKENLLKDIQTASKENENLLKEIQIASKDNQNLKNLTQKKDQQLQTATKLQNISENELKEAQQIIIQHKYSFEVLTEKLKHIINKFVERCEEKLINIKNIIKVHQEPEIKIDIEYLTKNLTLIEQDLQDFREGQTNLEQVKANFQQQVQNQLISLCNSSRIKDKEKTQIINTLTYIIYIFEIFDSLKGIMSKNSRLIQSRQTSEGSFDQTVSSYYHPRQSQPTNQKLI